VAWKVALKLVGASFLLLMAPIIVREGVEAMRGETCCGDGACH
jgi:hypothetical protein